VLERSQKIVVKACSSLRAVHTVPEFSPRPSDLNFHVMSVLFSDVASTKSTFHSSVFVLSFFFCSRDFGDEKLVRDEASRRFLVPSLIILPSVCVTRARVESCRFRSFASRFRSSPPLTGIFPPPPVLVFSGELVSFFWCSPEFCARFPPSDVGRTFDPYFLVAWT